ncbi:hypothetical protein [Crocosphaera sp. XPORK-15E]|uniref:hypothetical protein n=1 Tax=Crocosphaera sp. XPORK-15E TaxID=3110247 RepID=UPI002B1EDD0E|nr:hypothetical protein [Crocosphaera sp. XPORK-15E]MEA5535999.1 hypothetical protein [Crocosphaera sp. XPORK-15E]
MMKPRPANKPHSVYLSTRTHICPHCGYSHEERKDKGGARVWLETYFDVKVLVNENWNPPKNQEVKNG